MKEFVKKYFLFFVSTILVSVSLYLTTENLYKGIFLSLVFLLWCVFSKKIGVYKTTIIGIFLLLPFNITIQLPPSINILGLQILLSDPYVAGFWVNYLVPTLSILDIFVLILFVYILSKKGIKDIFRLDLVLFILGISILLLTVQNFLTTLLWIRLLVYLLTSIHIVKDLKTNFSVKKLLREGYIKYLLLVSILLQGVIGVLQFIKGTSLGISFLGESKIVNGMYGSSFIQIQGENLLRAYGTFPHPNILGGWFLLLLFISFLLYRYTKDRAYIFSMIFITIFSLFTFSRIVIFLVVLFLVLLTLRYIFKKRNIYSLSSLLYFRFLNIFNGEDSSFTDRWKLIKVNFEIFKENFLLGTTLGNSIRYYSDNIPITSGGRLLLQPVHNIFMLSIVEMGVLVGLYFWYLIYTYFIKDIQKKFLPLFILLCIFVIGMGDHYLLSLPQGNIIFFSFLILLTGSEL